jgi:hypothetical protein
MAKEQSYDAEISNSDEGPLTQIYITQAVNGIFAFVSAYLLVTLCYQLASLITGKVFSMEGTWHYYLVEMSPIDGHWKRRAIIASYAA